MFVVGCLLWLRFREGNLTGSRTKKTGCNEVKIQCPSLKNEGLPYLIVEDPVIIAFRGLEFDGKSSKISDGVRRSFLRSNG